MITNMNLQFSQILEKAYVKWREKQGVGENRSEAEFARWLGFVPQTVNSWKLKNPPSDDATIGTLARKFRELDRSLVPELYKSLGIDDPFHIETKDYIERFKDDEVIYNLAKKIHNAGTKLEEQLRKKKP